MAQARTLTEFQTKCEAALSAALQRVGRRLTNRTLGGESETYVKAQVDGTNLWVYIYEDEAAIEGLGTFEATNRLRGDELQTAFVEWVLGKAGA